MEDYLLMVILIRDTYKQKNPTKKELNNRRFEFVKNNKKNSVLL